ncbi:hypothetical protein KY290_019119 [Solanum tuberosum]|uniref:Uncharacterized protein n=1 Tax=Solanum tuberosum TaxID=4113 RepID=A0ABQ7VG75_SOLTU|nr:hypothetical protein KY284_022780 [Solanum tuberosum]KAH0703801.1 hypothetical protein KY285_018079 [Solanum tuberosum]KAH0763046.1 hypothetical protein KY290_019119 [Solanum tuberosum]
MNILVNFVQKIPSSCKLHKFMCWEYALNIHYTLTNGMLTVALTSSAHNNHLSEVLDHNLRSQIPITCVWPLMEPLDHWSIQTVEGVSHHSIHSSSVCSNERMNWPESYMEELNGVLVFWELKLSRCITYPRGKKRQTEKIT